MPGGDSRLDLVIRGGVVVTAEGRRQADVGVRDGRVVQLGQLGDDRLDGACVIDAAGRFVLPGGVDPHVHLHIDSHDDAPRWADDYESGSRAALAGGVTTLGAMSFVLPWETIGDRVRAETKAAAGKAIADLFFHTAVVTPTRETADDAARMVAAGQSSMKIFMSMPTFEPAATEFALLMKATGDAGGITLVHCEDLPTIDCCA